MMISSVRLVQKQSHKDKMDNTAWIKLSLPKTEELLVSINYFTGPFCIEPTLMLELFTPALIMLEKKCGLLLIWDTFYTIQKSW